MTNTATSMPRAAATDVTWLRLLQWSIALTVASVLVLGATILFATTTDEGPFRYAADYWLTGSGLPLAAGGIGITLAIHRLQHGADGRLGSVGLWINTLALVELVVQLGASIVVGRELQWGPMYILSTGLTFLGTALLAAGSWRTRLLPRWMLGVWPVVWVLGSFAGTGPVPAVLAVFLIILGATATRSVHART